MKRILLIAALFSCTALCAAPPAASGAVSEGRAPYGGEMLVCSTVAESSAAGFPQSKYIRPLEEWSVAADGARTCDFAVPFAWVNRQVVLHVESASRGYAVEIDGRRVGFTRSGMLPSEFVITKFVKEGRNQVRLVPFADDMAGVLSRESDEFTTGRCYVQSPAAVRVRDIVTNTVISADGGASAEFGIVLKSEMLNPKSTRVDYELFVNDSIRLHYGYKELTLDMRGEDTVRFATLLPDSCLWRLRRPCMLRLDVRTRNAGRYQECLTFRLGVRNISVSERGLVSVNGNLTALIVADVDPSISADEIVALREQGYNALHPRAGAVDRRLFDLCDSIGMYAIAQSPVSTSRWGDSRRVGGNPSNDATWTESFVDRAEGIYHTLKIHPSVVAFSIAEESSNGIALYETYLRLKSFGDARPVIYDGAGGEWNSDRLQRFTSPAAAGL